MSWAAISFKAWSRVASGWMVTGFRTMPDSYFLTTEAWRACSSGTRLRCNTPMPPSWAMAIASRPSVTVSMADDKIGMLREMVRVTRLVTLTWLGKTSEAAGSRSTSSKVSARPKSLSIGRLAMVLSSVGLTRGARPRTGRGSNVECAIAPGGREGKRGDLRLGCMFWRPSGACPRAGLPSGRRPHRLPSNFLATAH
jgi:hypothetical protein